MDVCQSSPHPYWSLAATAVELQEGRRGIPGHCRHNLPGAPERVAPALEYIVKILWINILV